MVTPAVSPRMFEFLTTLIFGALRGNHVAVKNTTEVGREVRQCWRRCVGCCVVKERDVTSMTVPPKNTSVTAHEFPREGFSPCL